MNLKHFLFFTQLSLLTIIANPCLNAQENFYKHMEGHLNEAIKLKADLIRIDNTLSGYYYYYFLDTLETKDFGMHYGKSLPIKGKISNDGQLEFSEYTGVIEGAFFKGQLSDGKIDGNWSSSDEKKTMPFMLQETYPEGTIAFYVFHLHDKGPLLETKSDPAASINLTLLLPKPYANAAPVDSVNRVIYQEFFGLDSVAAKPEKMLGESRDLFFKNYRKANADLYEEGAASFDWEKQKLVKIQYNEHQILSLEFFDYGYTGGAHGMTISKFVTISLEDGHKITLDDIFRDDYMNDLRDILNDMVRKKYDIQQSTDLRDAGFWMETIDPSDNFYMNKDGLGFYYNQYEVAPYAMGPVDIFIPYNKLKRIMDNTAQVYQAVFGNQ